MEILDLERKINMRVRKQMEKTQRSIICGSRCVPSKGIGRKDERLAEVEELRERIAEADLPEEVEEKALKELDRLEKCRQWLQRR